MVYRKYLTVGGGIGSFCWVDCLRVHAVAAEDIAVIGPQDKPYSQFKKYCDSIGLTFDKRLRSDSSARPDNFWGFPGYGLEEAINNIKNGKLKSGFGILAKLFGESAICEFYTPTAGMVYSSIDKEMKRIGWDEMFMKGMATKLSKAGNKFTVEMDNGEKISADNVFLSLGRSIKSTNYISAYDASGVYEKIKQSGGTVVVLGRGSSAAVVVEKLIDMHNTGANIKIISVFKDNDVGKKDKRNKKQDSFMGWRLQQFNWPRNSFGGKYMGTKDDVWKAATAIPRRNWMEKLKKAAEGNYYRVVYGKDFDADFVIDATGLDDRAESL